MESIYIKFVVFLNIIARQLERFTEEQGLLVDRRKPFTGVVAQHMQTAVPLGCPAQSEGPLSYAVPGPRGPRYGLKAIKNRATCCGFPDEDIELFIR